MLASIAQARQGPVPQATEHWAIAGGYEGIEHAQLVVLNVRNGGERTRCEQFLKDVDRIRKDASVFEDVLGWRGSKVPITAVVADLANPSDTRPDSPRGAPALRILKPRR